MDPIDGELMARARELGAAARLRTPPNPWVGCVIVNDGVIVGTGATEPPGGLHAEAQALVAADTLARGATAYVTLEPCAHQGRTPPCADALIAAGVRRVVTAVEDPDPEVRGRGHERLRAAGIEVEVGVGAVEVTQDLAPVPAPAPDRARVLPVEDGDEPRRARRGGRRHVAVDHRSRGARRRPPAARRVPGDRRGAGDRSRRPTVAHRARRGPRRRNRRCASCSTPTAASKPRVRSSTSRSRRRS